MIEFQKYIHIKYQLDKIQGSEDSVMNKLGKIPAFKEKFQKGEKQAIREFVIVISVTKKLKQVFMSDIQAKVVDEIPQTLAIFQQK